MSKFWKADAATSKKVIAMLNEWYETIKRAVKLAKRCGATDKILTGQAGFGRLYVCGFIFKDESKIDKKLFVRLKNSDMGWRVRHGKSELAKEFYGLHSDLKTDIANLIGMKTFDGLSFSTPGVSIHNGVAYISTNDSTKNAKGCKRISDVQYEKILGKDAKCP